MLPGVGREGGYALLGTLRVLDRLVKALVHAEYHSLAFVHQLMISRGHGYPHSLQIPSRARSGRGNAFLSLLTRPASRVAPCITAPSLPPQPHFLSPPAVTPRAKRGTSGMFGLLAPSPSQLFGYRRLGAGAAFVLIGHPPAKVHLLPVQNLRLDGVVSFGLRCYGLLASWVYPTSSQALAPAFSYLYTALESQ